MPSAVSAHRPAALQPDASRSAGGLDTFNQVALGTISAETSSIASPDKSAVSKQPGVSHSQSVHKSLSHRSASHPETPHKEQVRRYNFGVEAQTIPLNALQNDGKVRPERFIGRQKDTEQETIYYLSSRDYEKVYRAYHKASPDDRGPAQAIKDSFYISDRHISIIRLPDRPSSKSVLGADGGVYLSAEEKRYLDGLVAYEYSRAKGHSEYRAYYDFYRRVDPNRRGTGESTAMTPQEINDKVTVRIFELRQNHEISEQEFVRAFREMRYEVGENSFLDSLMHAADCGIDPSEIVRAENLSIAGEDFNTQDRITLSISRKAAERRRSAMNDDRMEQARDMGFDTASVETQRARIAPLLERESVRSEIADNSPITMQDSCFTLDRKARGYAHLSAVEHNRKLTLVSGKVVTGRLDVRYHSRTQEREPELPGYRVTFEYAAKSYELTDIPVITAGQKHPAGEVNYVVLGRSGPVMYWNGRPLRGQNAPDMLVTADGEVFTRQGVARTKGDKDYRVVVNAEGSEIHINDSARLKTRWHIPFIPTAMDLVGTTK